MDGKNKRKHRALRALYLVLLALVLCIATPSVWANERKPDSSQSAMVVAHEASDGSSSTEMSDQTQVNGNGSLHEDHSREQHVKIRNANDACVDMGSPVNDQGDPDAPQNQVDYGGGG